MTDILRNIIYIARRFKFATAMNMIGLIVAFAAFYLIMTQIVYQVTYNHDIEDYQRVYRLETGTDGGEYSFNVSRPLVQVLDTIPEVESYSMSTISDPSLDLYTFRKNETVLSLNFAEGNNTVVSSLTKREFHGNIKWTDSDQEGIIIPASIAIQFFDSVTVAGNTIELIYPDDAGDTIHHPYIVRGVYEDFPENSEIPNCIYQNVRDYDIDVLAERYKCYVKLKAVPGDIHPVEQSIKQAIVNEITENKQKYGLEADTTQIVESIIGMDIKLTPLGDCYFESSSRDNEESGYKTMLYILLLSCLLIIVIACSNFLNFTLAESPMRIRSLNTRLVLGASRRSLRLGMIAECAIVSVIASLVALAICALLSHLPLETHLIKGSIALSDHPWLVLITMLTAMLTGVLAGTYPAIFATSFPLAVALKSSFGLTPQGKRLRTILIALQLLISMLMFIYIGILFLQKYYISNSPYGYDKDMILTTSLPSGMSHEDKQKLCQELISIDIVKDATLASGILGYKDDAYFIDSENPQGDVIKIKFMYNSYNYLRAIGIKVIEGRDFQSGDSAVAIINETAWKQWKGWLHLGDKISTGVGTTDSAAVIGVCNDIRFGTTRINNSQPYVFILDNSDYNQKILYVSAYNKNDLEQARILASQKIRKYLSTDADSKTDSTSRLTSPSMEPFSKTLERTYRNEFTFFRFTNVLSLIGLFLTLIGAFCLTLFETEYRRKEIGIRKVAGATTREIVWMLCRHYGIIVLISFAVAAPLAYLLGRLTLNKFVECTDIQWWIYPLVLLVVGGVTLGTVMLQSWRTARENPAKSLKSE